VEAAREGARGTRPAFTGRELAPFPVDHTRRAGAPVYGMVWCPSYPPSATSVTGGSGVMHRPSGHSGQ
jgi:hypothetical protein